MEPSEQNQVCPHCQQTHPQGTLYCPLTGKSLVETSSSESGQPGPVFTPPPVENYPQPPLYPGTIQQPYYPPPYPSPYPPRPSKERSIALILEILPGLFGFLGFGWIYSGNTGAGIGWLIGFLLWTLIGTIISVATGGIGLICTLPISIVLIVVSAVTLNSYTKRNPQLFGP
jgi:hypothetical protein